MSKPDTQRFDSDGIWRKPPGAVRVDVTLKGGDARGGDPVSVVASGHAIVRGPGRSVPATEAETVTQSFAAGDLPDEVEVEIGKGGRPGGRDGYALIVTHLTEGGQP